MGRSRITSGGSQIRIRTENTYSKVAAARQNCSDTARPTQWQVASSGKSMIWSILRGRTHPHQALQATRYTTSKKRYPLTHFQRSTQGQVLSLRSSTSNQTPSSTLKSTNGKLKPWRSRLWKKQMLISKWLALWVEGRPRLKMQQLQKIVKLRLHYWMINKVKVVTKISSARCGATFRRVCKMRASPTEKSKQ